MRRIKPLVAALVAIGALAAIWAYTPAPADAAIYRYWAKCQGSTYAYPYKHTIYKTYNGVWKFLVPWCPAGYNYAGAVYQVGWYADRGYWIIPV